jgi:heat shock protein HslJ
MHKKTILLILTVFFIFGCSGNKNIKENEPSNPILRLHDIWALTSINGLSENINIERRPTIEIFPEKKEIVGFGGCNNYSGPILEVNATAISFGAIMSTKMACEQLDLESKYFTALQATKKYSLNDLELTFLDGQGVPILIFRKVD